MTFAEFYTREITDLVTQEAAKKVNLIFVILGQSQIIHTEAVHDNLIDSSTFKVNGSHTVFDKNWCTAMLTKLGTNKSFHLLSYAQFSYLVQYCGTSYFTERVIILRDNLRHLFPLDKAEFIEKSSEENIEKRPKNLPIYQAEQIHINDLYLYSIVAPSEKFTCLDIFKKSKKTGLTTFQNLEAIDVSSDQYALDYFVNKCILDNRLNKTAVLKIYKKQQLSPGLIKSIKNVNYVLNVFGGGLYELEEEIIEADYKEKKETNELLKKYWGENAQFRNLKVYSNPNEGNETIEISQALIVETIIDEYECAKQQQQPRDLFLTAPTGAGKSLLFQLPAFYISQKGDVTIVVSPLIALMKDQVNTIVKERKYKKVAYLNSELSLTDRGRVIESCQDGEIDILYLSPELLLSYDITHFIRDRKLGLLVIDEAHLITTWGRDFRVDYWFLGYHIRRIRKYKGLNFPMVAVTATAIYGGPNDMVFDSIDSLVMHHPHIYIGQVKRQDITFAINNYDSFERDYENNKLEQTVSFIRNIHEIGIKTLVYVPYIKHIRQILDKLSSNQLDIATGYYGSLPADQKELAFREFKTGQKKVMISTKAFGMGVDISDIELVYHHAPSGLLPDYIQEIGRVARQSDVKGFAALQYSSQDQRFAKALHNMSALRQFQLREILKKIYKIYTKNDRKRNVLLSVEDFGYIFENKVDLDQKVLTALMMIEKDYLTKLDFNVLVARPKKLFVKAYAKLNSEDLAAYNQTYPNTSEYILDLGNDQNIIEIDLDRLWFQNFDDKSFPTLKREFYAETLFKDEGLELSPQLNISFERFKSFGYILVAIEKLFTAVQRIFIEFDNAFFTSNEFEKKLNQYLNDSDKAEKISHFILSTYSGWLIQQGALESHAFLQKRRAIDGYKYKVFNKKYLTNFRAIVNRFKTLFEETESSVVSRFVTNREHNSINYIRLGYYLEMLELGTFEIKGGEKQMIFIRINDPDRIKEDSKNYEYTNSLLSSTERRHHLSHKIFDHFFLRQFSNEERWDFVEDFFLGSEVKSLLENHTGSDTEKLNIIEFLKDNSAPLQSEPKKMDEQGFIHIFKPKPETFYDIDNLLTIENEESIQTMKISEWLAKDPVSFDIIRRKEKLRVDKNTFQILISKLRANHPDYYKKSLGLNHKIIFPGYALPVSATVPYKDRPIDFYKWWCQNSGEVHMTFQQRITLFVKVYQERPSVLKAEHKKIINK